MVTLKSKMLVWDWGVGRVEAVNREFCVHNTTSGIIESRHNTLKKLWGQYLILGCGHADTFDFGCPEMSYVAHVKNKRMSFFYFM